ncbi:MAG: hypothetical protein Q8930_14740 [Bacillota bacterium]|nr:hypothetical protein [Bacillota bacterium]
MSNYCLSLLDKDQKVVWEMNPNDFKDKDHIMMNGNSAEGVYNIERYT